MLKTIALGISVVVVGSGVALAQPPRIALSQPAEKFLLAKHDKADKEERGRGRKLGHYKQRGVDDQDDDEVTTTTTTTRRSTARQRSTNPGWYSPAPMPRYGSGSSYYPPPYYDYGPPPYYRGY